MKKIALLILALPAIAACDKDKNNYKTPEEYFSFYTDGVYYDYPQEEGSLIFVDRKTLGAGPTLRFQGYTESGPAEGQGEYKVFYRKPIIIIDGFDPGDERHITSGIANLI